MKKYILLIILFLSIILNLFLVFWDSLKEKWYKYNSDEIKFEHRKWWLEEIYQGIWILSYTPDITEDYYEIIPLKKRVNWEYMIWDSILTEEDYQNHINELKAKIKWSIILKAWDKKYIYYDRYATELLKFEKNNNVKFNLEKYDFVKLY